MKKILLIILILVAIGIVAFFVLGKHSQKGQALGLINGSLSKCAQKPNCVCSEFKDDIEHYIEPITDIQLSESQIQTKIISTIQEMGGVVQIEEANYIAATFTSKIFGFVDDFEIRIETNQDTGKNIIHIRSASRVGHSDGGVNNKRVEQFKRLLKGG